MSYHIKFLFEKMQYGNADAEALVECCVEAGFEEAIDPAFLSPGEAVEVTKGDSRLAGLLMEAGKKTRPLIDSWAKFGVRAGMGGGEGAPGAVVESGRCVLRDLPDQRPPLSPFPPRGRRVFRMPKGLFGLLVSSGRQPGRFKKKENLSGRAPP